MDGVTLGKNTYPFNKDGSIHKIALRNATHQQLKTLMKTSHAIATDVELEFIRRYKGEQNQ